MLRKKWGRRRVVIVNSEVGKISMRVVIKTRVYGFVEKSEMGNKR